MKRQKVSEDHDKLIEALAARGIGYSTISVEEHLRQEAARQRKLGIFGWPDFGNLKYPGLFTVHLDYFATGEGSTRGLAICACPDRPGLERYIVRTFGRYYGKGVEVRQGIRPLPGYENLIPPLPRTLMRKLRRQELACAFEFHTQIHLNCS